MPQLNAYIDKELLTALDTKVEEIKATTGIETSRSALAAAALRAFLLPVRTEKSTIGLKKEEADSVTEVTA